MRNSPRISRRKSGRRIKFLYTQLFISGCNNNCSFNFPPYFRKEQAFATNLMERTWYSNVWIGLNDLKTKGVYEWSDNSLVSWTNWYVGQPDERRTDKSCVYMSLRRGKQGWMYWSDQNCTNRYAFMCAYDIAGKYVSICNGVVGLKY